MKKKIIDYIEQLEAKALQTDDYFKQRNDLYIENQKLHNIIKEVREYIDFMYEQFEKIEDKELITNRVIDISVLEKILKILDKGSDINEQSNNSRKE